MKAQTARQESGGDTRKERALGRYAAPVAAPASASGNAAYRTAEQRSDAARAGGLAVVERYGSAHMRRIGAMARRGPLTLPRFGSAAVSRTSVMPAGVTDIRRGVRATAPEPGQFPNQAGGGAERSSLAFPQGGFHEAKVRANRTSPTGAHTDAVGIASDAGAPQGAEHKGRGVRSTTAPRNARGG